MKENSHKQNSKDVLNFQNEFSSNMPNIILLLQRCSTRFRNLKGLNNKSQTKFYEIPDTKSSRCASLGFGKKVQFGKQYFEKPGPGKYQIKGDFQTDKRKGITISAGRQVVKNNSLFLVDKSKLGPGQYDPYNPLLKQDKSFTLSSRTLDVSNKWKKQVPGPGAYETIQLLDKNLKSVNSKINNVKSAVFSKQKRGGQIQSLMMKNIPGPGQYEKAKDSEINIKFTNKLGFKFSHGQRQGISNKSKTQIPGPGSYRVYSQFNSIVK